MILYMAQKSEKLFIGPKLRRYRQSLGLTQSRMAGELDISTSYLNLIENNQRPLSAALLLRLAENYDIDLSEFGGSGDARLVAELYEILNEPVFKSETGEVMAPKTELEAVVAASPGFARAFLKIHQAARHTAAQNNNLNEQFTDRGKVELFEDATAPLEIVRKFIHDSHNYFPQLDEAAELLSMDIAGVDGKFRPERLYGALRRRLESDHQLATRIVPADVMSERLRYFDRHGRRINLSELLSAPGRCFQLAYQLATLEQNRTIDRLIDASNITNEQAKRLARVTLANYFAAAILMPYTLFLQAAETNKYDIEMLSHRFLASFEQVAHRLTTLQRTGARGVPFFFIRIDIAGNISKRLSSGSFNFSKFGGTCPLWNLHECFQTPEKIHTQIIQLPEERPYFSIARTVRRAGGSFAKPAQQLAVALGCDIRHASRLVYAEPYQLDEPTPVPIGINCYLCERRDCTQRAYAPINQRALYDERIRSTSLVSFSDKEM